MNRDLLLTEIFPPKTGGSGRWLWEIYRRLPRERYLIAAGEQAGDKAFDRTHNVAVQRLPLTLASWGLRDFRGVKGYWRGLKRLLPLVRTKGVRRIHCGRTLPEGFMALALRWWSGVSYLCYVHGEELNYAAQSRELAWMARRVMRGAELLIANSRNTRRILIEDWAAPPDKVHVLHPGVDTSYFRPAAADESLRKKLGWEGRAVVLTVGRLQKRKGHDVLIEAVAAVRRRIPEVLYAIAGDGEERQNLEKQARAAGLAEHVQFLGEIPDAELLRCYQQCELFVLPNRQVAQDFEGFGMVLLEAQACGKPVIAGASGGTAETMRIGETGRVVNCDGPEVLAEVVVELLNDQPLRERMGAAARAWAVGQFDWSALSQQAEELFEAGTHAKVQKRKPISSPGVFA